MTHYYCPVCGWNGLETPPSFPYSSQEICACCGTQFGLDVVKDKDVADVRTDWLQEGAPWFDDEPDVNPRMPSGWNTDMAKHQIQENLKIDI